MYKYSLDPSSKKYTCPSCGKKSFVVYIDTESKEAVDTNQYGRCDRENSCNYHLKPPYKKDEAGVPVVHVPAPPVVVQQIFPDEKIWKPIVGRTKTCVSPLHLFLAKTLLIPNEHFIKWGVCSDTDGDGNQLTVYVFRDIEQRITNLKWFKYKEDGHRDKNHNSFSLRQPPPTPPFRSLNSGQRMMKFPIKTVKGKIHLA